MFLFFQVKGRGFLYGILPVLCFSCAVPKTSLQHSGQFSNLRTEITLNNGARFVGYTTYQTGMDPAMQVYNPATRTTTNISLEEINKLEIEEEAFLIKWIETPVQARKQGMPHKRLVVLRRLLDENPDIQIFEYKFPVKNPKSPVNKTETAFYVQFGQEFSQPLTQMGTPAFDQHWKRFFKGAPVFSDPLVGSPKPPKSLKSLLKFAQSFSSLEAGGTPADITE